MTDRMEPTIPNPDRPVVPDGYGIPTGSQGTLPWSFVDERMTGSLNYWISTVTPSGRPHAVPVWGAWLDSKLYIEGSPETRRHKNLKNNPNVVAHLEDGSKVVIIEGTAEEMGKPDPSLAGRLSETFTRKYASFGYSPGPDNWDNGGLYVITPRKVFAWSRFPDDTTRWRLKR